MSLMWYDPFDFTSPSRLSNQRFGMMLDPEDLITHTLPRQFNRLLSWPNYYRPWTSSTAQKDAGSSLSLDKDKFQVNLDVQQFRPNEITVKVGSDNVIVVEGKHEERPDEHGFISRQFIRKYLLPRDHDLNRVQSSLSSDGVLTITAPKKAAVEAKDREIPVVQTGQPSAIIERKTEDNAACKLPECKPAECKLPEYKPVEKNIEIQKEVQTSPLVQSPTEIIPGEKIIEIKQEGSGPASPAP